jgi:hypothetical protein
MTENNHFGRDMMDVAFEHEVYQVVRSYLDYFHAQLKEGGENKEELENIRQLANQLFECIRFLIIYLQ